MDYIASAVSVDFYFFGVVWSYLYFLFGHSGDGMVISEHNSYPYYPAANPLISINKSLKSLDTFPTVSQNYSGSVFTLRVGVLGTPVT